MMETTISDLQKAKRELEDAILKNVDSLVRDFSERTGVYPRGISIDFVEVTTFGDKSKKYLVSSVRSNVEI